MHRRAHIGTYGCRGSLRLRSIRDMRARLIRRMGSLISRSGNTHPGRGASPNRYVDAFFDKVSFHHWSSSSATTR